MKVRMLAVFSILTLAAWLPIQAQQNATPAAPAPQAQTPGAPSEKGQASAKHSCCCDPEKKPGQDAAAAKPDHQAMDCCQGATEAICAAKNGQTCCSGQNGKDGKDCCAGMAGQCAGHATGK